MSVNLNVNGQIYPYPEAGDDNWGQNATTWAQAITSSTLQKNGGVFTLTSNVDFGGNFGLISQFYRSRSANTALTGSVRLANGDQINFRNSANTADLPLTVNVSDELTFNGGAFLTSLYTGLTDFNIAGAAGIAYSKMEALTASRAIISDASGALTVSSASSTEVSYLVGVTSSVQTQIDNKLSLSGGSLSGSLILAGAPTLSNEAATKAYVDAASQGLQVKAPVQLATTANITLSGEQTIDGVLTSSSRVLVKNQADLTKNGIYTSSAGAWSRTTDMDVWSEVFQAYVFVQAGTQNAFSGYYFTVPSVGTIDVTNIVVQQFSQAGQVSTDGQGIEITGSILSLELDGSTLTKSGSGLKVSDSLVNTINAKLTDPMSTNGDLITRAAGVPTRLGIGTTGQILRVVGGTPAWSDQNVNLSTQTVSSNITLSDSNKVYFVNTSSARSLQLPTPVAGLNFIIKDITGSANTNNITLVRNSSEQIEGVSASKVLQTNWGSWRVISDGTNWYLI